MLQKLCAAWRARRVVICGDGPCAAPQLCAWLTILGARPVCLSEDAPSVTLMRALTDGRVSAALVCCGHLPPALAAEIREAGVPLTLLIPPASGEDGALRALAFGARFFAEGDMPCGVYDLGADEVRQV